MNYQVLWLIYVVSGLGEQMDIAVDRLSHEQTKLALAFRHGTTLKEKIVDQQLQMAEDAHGDSRISRLENVEASTFTLSPFKLSEIDYIRRANTNNPITVLGMEVTRGLFLTLVGLLATNVGSVLVKMVPTDTIKQIVTNKPA